MEHIIVLDFGGQYNQLIARRVRECGVFAEVLPSTASPDRLKGREGLKGIILTGGPDSVYAQGSSSCPITFFRWACPF